MKPWLLEILACPVDKHYPLSLDVFTIEDEDEFIKKAGDVKAMAGDLAGFFEPVNDEEPGEDQVVIHVAEVDGKLMVFDTLVRKPVPVLEYLDGIKSSIEELRPIKNHAHPKVNEVLASLLAFGQEVDKARAAIAREGNAKGAGVSTITALTPDLVLLNWFKQAVEIDEGIMACKGCNRWFPVRETIPQLLPDELRKQKYDVDFLAKWKDRVDPTVLQAGLPFHL